MKNTPLILLLPILILTACDDENPSVNTGTGQVKKVEGFFNGAPIDDLTQITYDEDQKITSIQFSQGGATSRTYEVTYEGNEVSMLTIIRAFQNSGSTVEEDFEVEHQDGQITLSSTDVQYRYKMTVNDGFLETFEDHFDKANGYFHEAHFIRDAANNIDTISYFTTNTTDTNLLVWQYTFHNFEEEALLNDAFNPVYNYAFSLYDPFIGLALGLQVSAEPPLRSSYMDAGGTFTAENVKAEIEELDNGRLTKLGYTLEYLPGNDYHLEFEYQ